MKKREFKLMNVSIKKINSAYAEAEKENPEINIKDGKLNDSGKVCLYVGNKEVGFCGKKECKRKASSMYKCTYCKYAFCRVHRLPEIHSCVEMEKCIEDAVRKHAEKLKKCKILKNKI